MMEKFILSVSLITSLGIILVVCINLLLGVSRPVFWFSTLTVIVLAVGLSSLALGFGARFPKFSMENIAQAETSFGGVLCLLCAMLYIGLTLAIEARGMQLYMRQMYTHTTYPGGMLYILRFCIIDLLLLNGMAVLLPLWIGTRAITSYELREWSV